MIPESEIAIRLGCAVILSGIVGLEREVHEASAGLRTHALVGLGAALFMVVSLFGFGDALAQPHASYDPSRVSSLVVSGVGFLGAGAILNARGSVRGLTTAASVWTAAAIGLASGCGLFAAAGMATLGVLFVLVCVKGLEKRMPASWRRQRVTAVYDSAQVKLSTLLASLERSALVKDVKVNIGDDPGMRTVEIQLDPKVSAPELHSILISLGEIAGVRGISSVR